VNLLEPEKILMMNEEAISIFQFQFSNMDGMVAQW